MVLAPVAERIAHSSGTNFIGRNGAAAASLADRETEKCAARARRISEGMVDAARICCEAVVESGGTEELFADSCVRYFKRLCRKTPAFSRGGVTSRVVLQFGLACAYMHREGFAVGDTVLFEKLDSFADNLPKTYALTRAQHKVRSITRIQDAIRKLVRDTGPDNSKLNDFIFPTFKTSMEPSKALTV